MRPHTGSPGIGEEFEEDATDNTVSPSELASILTDVIKVMDEVGSFLVPQK